MPLSGNGWGHFAAAGGGGSIHREKYREILTEEAFVWYGKGANKRKGR